MTDLTFANLVDIEQIRELLEAHYKITGIGAAILDTDENILVAIGYHDICTRFHLVHPQAKQNCRESDAYIKAHLSECNGGYLDYRCKNGLVDVAVPIMIDGQHFATFFTGQFFYDDDMPDVEYFRKQAEKFGFDEGAYLEALNRVPIFSRERIRKTVEYYRTLVRIITGMGIQNLELRREAAELNEAKEALLISRFCIDNAGIGIYRTDENGTIFSINDHACKCLGYTEDELLALSVFDIDPVITRERMIELKEILDANGSVTHESIHRRKDGTTFPVEITANLLEFDGKTYGISFVKDITERKQVEEELLLTQHCFDNASIAIHRAQSDGKISHANKQMCRNLGYTRAELNSMSVFEIDPAITPEKLLGMERLARENGSCTFESKHCRKDGTSFPVEITVNYWDINGRKMHMVFVQDITERKQAEEALRESEAQVRRKLASILDPEGGIGELDLADIIDAPQIQALVNDLYRNTGVKMSIIDLKGKVLVDVGWQEICLKYHRGHPETRERCRESDTVMTEGVPQGEFRTYKCRNNMWHMVTPIFVGGKHMGNLFMGQFFFENEELDYGLFRSQARKYGFPEDEYIAALEAVPRHSEECVNKGKAFFLRLIEMFSRLSYGNIKLARLLAERDQLAGALLKAHAELESRVIERTEQLSAITYEISLAEERERRRIAGELHDQVGQSLILSKLKLDSISPSLSPGELESLLGEIREHLGRSIENTRSLTFQLSPPLLYEVGFEAAVEWLADEFEEEFGLKASFHDDKEPKPLDEKGSIILYQMVRELLINIAKHAEAKSVNITVVKELDKIRVVVADDGKGIDPAMSLRTITRNGTFGLFNIRHRIEHLGGSLAIESDIGCGTRVSLYLPLRQGRDKDGRTDGNQDHTRG